MCGRDYTTYTVEQLHARYLSRTTWQWSFDDTIPPFKPNYNTCPSHKCLVLCVEDEKLKFKEMRWGLVPSWAKSVKDADKYSMINAKSEEISEKRSYKNAFQKRRCIVPVSGFYEWQRNGKSKKPFAIHLKDQSIMSLAGIWEHWKDPEGIETVDSFSIITTTANAFMSKIHNRMPVILQENDEATWLNPSLSSLQELSPIMRSSEAATLDAFEISILVNSPKNNSSDILNKLITLK